MNAHFSRRTPRAAFIALAIVMTVLSAAFVDFLATDHAVSRRATAQAAATPVQASVLAQRR
jgi:hypothetical protein